MAEQLTTDQKVEVRRALRAISQVLRDALNGEADTLIAIETAKQLAEHALEQIGLP